MACRGGFRGGNQPLRSVRFNDQKSGRDRGARSPQDHPDEKVAEFGTGSQDCRAAEPKERHDSFDRGRVEASSDRHH